MVTLQPPAPMALSLSGHRSGTAFVAQPTLPAGESVRAALTPRAQVSLRPLLPSRHVSLVTTLPSRDLVLARPLHVMPTLREAVPLCVPLTTRPISTSSVPATMSLTGLPWLRVSVPTAATMSLVHRTSARGRGGTFIKPLGQFSGVPRGPLLACLQLPSCRCSCSCARHGHPRGCSHRPSQSSPETQSPQRSPCRCS